MTEKEQVKEFKTEVEKDIKKGRMHWETVAAFGILVLVVAGIGFGAWWYLGNQEVNDDISTNLNYKKITSSDVSNDETSSWKTYTSSKYGFSIKYPGSWTVYENITKETGKSDYVTANLFSDDNVVFDNKTDGYAISLNMDNIYGRGGTCVKRNIIYSTSIVSNKLILVEASDTDNSSKPLGEDMMCGGAALSGYAISTVPTSGNYQQFNGHNYFFHSESTTLADTKVDAVADYFEKMMATMTWK